MNPMDDSLQKTRGQQLLKMLTSSQNLDHEKALSLIHAGADLEVSGVTGMTPLLWACERRYANIVAELLAAGAVVDAAETVIGMTSLMIAAENGDADICALLTEHGAEIEKVTLEEQPAAGSIAGGTALIFAIGNMRVDVVDTLLKAGADPNHPDHRGVTPLKHACYGCLKQGGNAEAAFMCVRKLVESGADTNWLKEGKGLRGDDDNKVVQFIEQVLLERNLAKVEEWRKKGCPATGVVKRIAPLRLKTPQKPF